MTDHELYDEILLNRATHPLYADSLRITNKNGYAKNALCGDFVQIHLFCSDGKVEEIQHDTQGCLICKAAADIMAESVKGLFLKDISEEFEKFVKVVTQGKVTGEESLYFAFSTLYNYKSRIRCATLPWYALLSALGIENSSDSRVGRNVSYGRQ